MSKQNEKITFPESIFDDLEKMGKRQERELSNSWLLIWSLVILAFLLGLVGYLVTDPAILMSASGIGW